MTRLLLLIFLIFCSIFTITLASQRGPPLVLGLDTGSHSVKVAYVQRSKPIDLLLNEQSKRKTSNIFAFRTRDERTFGDPAKSIAARYPRSIVKNYSKWIGKNWSERVQSEWLNARLANSLGMKYAEWRKNSERGTIDIITRGQDKQEQSFEAEELMSYMLRSISTYATGPINGVVIAIPPYFTFEERQAIKDAAQLSGLNLVGLIHETTAAALQYGTSRYARIKQQWNEKKTASKSKASSATHNVLFVDFGATSTKVSVAQYTPSQKSSGLELGGLKILSQTWDEHLGGDDFTARLANHFSDLFQEKHGEDLKKHPKSYERLLAYAEKAKEVLTANSETVVFLETIWNDIDFRIHITRDDFEELCSDLISRVAVPIQKAVDESGLKMSDIDALEILGGASRVRSIQNQLTKIYGRDISHSLNADEAVSLGAALYAASQSAMFRVRSFALTNTFPYKIDFVLSSVDEKPPKTYNLFKKHDVTDFKKYVNIPRSEDFSITLKYNTDAAPQFVDESNSVIVQYDLHNVANAMKEFTETLEQDKSAKSKVRISFELTKDGLLQLDAATATLEQTIQVPIPQKKTNTTANSTETTEEPQKFKTEKKYTRINIDTKKTSFIRPGLSTEQLQRMSDRIKQYETQEKLKQMIARARNELESYVYSTQSSILDDEEYRPYFTQEEADKLSTMLTEADDWLAQTDDDMSIELQTFKGKLENMKQISNPIIERREEHRRRDEESASCNSIFKLTQQSMKKLRENSPHITEEEIGSVFKLIEDTKQWLDSAFKKQDAIPLSQAPLLRGEEIQSKCKQVQLLALKISSKPPPVKIETNETTNSNTESNQENPEQPEEPKKDEL